MLLAAPPLAPHPPRHSRFRPKLSLQITTITAFAPPLLPANLSPTTRNTQMNRAITAPCFSIDNNSGSSSSSSSSSDDDPPSISPNPKDKRRRRRAAQQKKAMSQHQPTTVGASFMPPQQPDRRGRELKRGKRVGFVEKATLHTYDVEEESEEEDGSVVVTAMERCRELERLRAWVRENTDGGMEEEEEREWVRKLVELEMGAIEREEREEEAGQMATQQQ